MPQRFDSISRWNHLLAAIVAIKMQIVNRKRKINTKSA
nr:MAG TPA: hypothetical protein [Caudoviricetes sp.]